MLDYNKKVYELIHFLKKNDNIDEIIKRDNMTIVKLINELEKYTKDIINIINDSTNDSSVEDNWIGWNN